MALYEVDKYTDDNFKRFKVCDLLEKLFPGYRVKESLSEGEMPKTLVTVNVLNCIITLLYGIISYRLYEFKQDYLLLFKGGRALQLSLNDIPNLTKYFSEDADILIIPNNSIQSEHNFEKMQILSSHIAYLIKWFIPEEINIVVSLPSNPKNTNKEITKVLYNDGPLYKALSDIGFGEIDEDIRMYFDNPSYSQFYLDHFETITLFITPIMNDILNEKLYIYSKYSNMKHKLDNDEPITEEGYEGLTKSVCGFYMYKFNRAIKQIVNSILKRDYVNVSENETKLIMPDLDPNFRRYSRKEKIDIYNKIDEVSRRVLKKYIDNFHDLSSEQKNRIIIELFPNALLI
jgi:hypothetical protein